MVFGRKDYRNGAFRINPGLFASRFVAPLTRSLKFMLRNISTNQTIDLDVPFIVRKPIDFQTSKELWNFCLAPKPQPIEKPINEVEQQTDNIQHDLDIASDIQQGQTFEIHDSKPHFIKRNGLLNAPLYATPTFAIYALNQDTAIFKIGSFIAGECFETVEAWEKGLVVIEELEFTKLIIDVSGNGGGIICAGYALVILLFPDMKGFEHYSDFVWSKLLGKLIKKAEYVGEIDSLFHYQRTWMDTQDKGKFWNSNWLIQGHEETRNGSRYDLFIVDLIQVQIILVKHN